MGVSVRLREVSTYRRFKMKSCSKEIAGTANLCLLMRGVCLRTVCFAMEESGAFDVVRH